MTCDCDPAAEPLLFPETETATPLEHVLGHAALIPALIVLLHLPLLSGDKRLAFRDVSHFYTPLYGYVADRQADDWLPLWNPLDQTGMPLIGEASTAVLYPPRMIIYALPLGDETSIGWYVVLHWILAASSIRWIAMQALRRRVLANVAAGVFALSGTIGFLGCNPPFLAAAAWLPLALWPMTLSPVNRPLMAGLAMAMMILAGDPQTALHAVLIGCIVTTVRHVGDWTGMSRALLTRIAAACCLAVCLALPQIAASMHWVSQSDRGTASRLSQIYHFSLPPWQLLELFSPQPWGDLLPRYARWSRLFSDDAMVWTTSIYGGWLTGVALILTTAALIRRNPPSPVGTGVIDRSPVRTWWSVAVLAIMAGMGRYGLVWLLQTLTPVLAHADGSIGGLYWWLLHIVPGYDSFRYPTKWLAVFQCAAAMLTATWLAGLRSNDLRHLGRVAVAAVLVCCIAVMLSWGVNMSCQVNDRFWGPLETSLGLHQLRSSLMHTAIIAAAVAGVVRLGIRRGQHSPGPRVAVGLVLILLVDLTVAARHWTKSVDRETEQRLLKELTPHEPAPPDVRVLRTREGSLWPEYWRKHGSDHRLVDVEASLRAGGFGRWHLAQRTAVFNNLASIHPEVNRSFWRSVHRHVRDLSPSQRNDVWERLRRRLRLGGSWHQLDQARLVTIDGREHALMQTIHSQVSNVPEPLSFSTHCIPFSGDDDAFSDALMATLDQDLPVIETQDVVRPPSTLLGNRSTASIQIQHRSEQLCVATIVSGSGGWLHRMTLQDGNWIAQIRDPQPGVSSGGGWKTIPIRRADLLGQAVWVPAGVHEIRFRYQPAWWPASLGLSLATWLATLAYAGWTDRRRWFGPA